MLQVAEYQVDLAHHHQIIILVPLLSLSLFYHQIVISVIAIYGQEEEIDDDPYSTICYHGLTYDEKSHYHNKGMQDSLNPRYKRTQEIHW